MKFAAAGSCLLFLMLAACGSGEDDVLTPDKIRASESAPVLPDVELSNEPEPAPQPAPALPPELNAAAGDEAGNGLNEAEPVVQGVRSSIPAAFHGRWGESAEDCAPDGPGFVEISPNRMQFYESTGQLLRVDGDFPERFIGIFGYSGEGERWTERDQLVLTGSSNTLVLATKDGRFTYQRCR